MELSVRFSWLLLEEFEIRRTTQLQHEYNNIKHEYVFRLMVDKDEQIDSGVLLCAWKINSILSRASWSKMRCFYVYRLATDDITWRKHWGSPIDIESPQWRNVHSYVKLIQMWHSMILAKFGSRNGLNKYICFTSDQQAEMKDHTRQFGHFIRAALIILLSFAILKCSLHWTIRILTNKTRVRE